MILEPLAALARLLLYGGALVGAGTALAWASFRDGLGKLQEEAPRRIAAGALAAVASAVAGAVLLVIRLGGSIDGPTLSAVFGGPTGVVLFAQIVGGVLLLATARGAAVRPLRLLGALALPASFGVTGHSVAFSPWAGFLAASHLLAAAWWLGGLLFLRQACRSLGARELVALTRWFSRLAFSIVSCLAATGAVLVLALVSPTWEAWSTPYARNLALKLALAAAALAIANWNRTRLVPLLASGRPEAPQRLRRALSLEIALIFAVLAATAWLTTFYSPHGGH